MIRPGRTKLKRALRRVVEAHDRACLTGKTRPLVEAIEDARRLFPDLMEDVSHIPEGER